MGIAIRKNVRILLLNQDKEILLISANDPALTNNDGTPKGKFWFTIGGQIEKGESFEQAAYRELLEETGFEADNINLGPIVWKENKKIIYHGKELELENYYYVAKTIYTDNFNSNNFTELEQQVILGLKWWSLEEIKTSNEQIFPESLEEHLQEILEEVYPEKIKCI